MPTTRASSVATRNHRRRKGRRPLLELDSGNGDQAKMQREEQREAAAGPAVQVAACAPEGALSFAHGCTGASSRRRSSGSSKWSLLQWLAVAHGTTTLVLTCSGWPFRLCGFCKNKKFLRSLKKKLLLLLLLLFHA